MKDRIETALAAIDEAAEELIALGRKIHANPELGGEEKKALEAIVKTLKKRGFSVKTQIGGWDTAYVASPAPRDENLPSVALLAEYDALPGLGHACGHNLIAVAGVAAAIGAAAAIDPSEGHVASIGTPAEENRGGKISMAEEGVFDGYDAAMMVHPEFRNEAYVKTLGMTEFLVTYHGKAAHASASPEMGINALDAMISLFNNVGLLRQQMRDDARIHGIITHGGDAANIIPDRTEARFMVRAKEKVYHNKLREQFISCAQAASFATGCKVDVQSFPTYDPFVTNKALADLFSEAALALGVEMGRRELEDGLGSSDIGNLCLRCPTIHPLIDVGVRPASALHTEEFEKTADDDQSYQSALTAGKAMAAAAVALILDPQRRQQVAEEFQALKKAQETPETQ